ncbi:MAG: 1-acyl-sn-glycerol-3-phosphate acyltransferase [Bacteroidales bacterium]|nr:1-acyl-sn-glycerol-3-phosphate acyltransferase [Bacteroidales bacterium]
MQMTEFDNIRPYSDEEAVEALGRVSRHALIPIISKYLFPKEQSNILAKALRDVKDIDSFQDNIMLGAVNSILAKTSEGFSVSGQENLLKLKGRKFLAISNHRDIVLDPALIQYALHDCGLPYSQVCVGNNLLSNKLVEDLMRSNRMITVIRGISARELYLSSQILSKYIRQTITSGESSVWIAQREGRTKDGRDTTEQGLLKMFDLSGEKGFVENFKELNILPLSISYEYESCDSRKARELVIKSMNGGSYTKKRNEDLHSILTGIRQRKGHIHLSIGEPLTAQEIEEASAFNGNDRYQAVRRALDRRIISGYKLFKTNYMAYDMLKGTHSYLGVKYLPDDVTAFSEYVSHKLGKLEKRLDRESLRQVFLGIYANPVESKFDIDNPTNI